MPTISVYLDELCALLEEEVTEKSFDELCFEFGLELDEVTSEFEQVAREQGKDKAAGLSTRTIFKIDVPANRYDLCCVEGITQALRIFLGKDPVPEFRYSIPVIKQVMHVKPDTTKIRPFVVAAVLRNVTFDEGRYQSFIELQDKLHHNICRRRQLVAIGTHDLDTIQGPFTYEALPPKEINFAPLNVDESMDAEQMMEFYSTHQQLKQYLPIIRDSPVYPVIYDSNRTVLSMPPIINGDVSKIKLSTKNLFIECTATDHTKAVTTLNTIIAAFSQYCGDKYTIEPVDVVYPEDHESAFKGQTKTYPVLEKIPMDASCNRLKKRLDLMHLTGEEVSDYLLKMSLPNTLDADGDTLHVEVPITRSDVMHECDLLEDLAIAFGYNNLKAVVPPVHCTAQEQPVNHLTDLIRQEFAQAGFYEALTWGLVSHAENYGNLRREEKDIVSKHEDEYNPFVKCVTLANPKTREFEIVRSSLLPGLLKTLGANKHNSPPIKIFEVSDVVFQCDSVDTGCRNNRRAAALFMGTSTAGFDYIHGLLDQIMLKLNVCHVTTPMKNRKMYKLEPSSDPAFFDGFQASVVLEGVNIGVIGVLHPEVLAAYNIDSPCAAFEFNLECFLKHLKI